MNTDNEVLYMFLFNIYNFKYSILRNCWFYLKIKIIFMN